jgi:redox-sensitive bicupin YhaK (pirin superfamily)
MQAALFPANERGSADYGWLKPNYYFSFGPYYNPERVHFGALRVLNDDFIAGGGMFPAHPHDNMEIITIPFTGALAHRDSTGGSGTIEAGDVQIMSAGSGITHSEANASATEPVTLFQIWLFPKIKNIAPRYDQRRFDAVGRQNQWQILVSPLENDHALWINQDARLARVDLTPGAQIDYQLGFPGNGVFLVNIAGEVTVGDYRLDQRDALGIRHTERISITAEESSSILVIEVPMEDNPG